MSVSNLCFQCVCLFPVPLLPSNDKGKHQHSLFFFFFCGNKKNWMNERMKSSRRCRFDSSSHYFIQLLTSQEKESFATLLLVNHWCFLFFYDFFVFFLFLFFLFFYTFFCHSVDATLKKALFFQTNTSPSLVICKRQRESHLDSFAWNIQMKQVQPFSFVFL